MLNKLTELLYLTCIYISNQIPLLCHSVFEINFVVLHYTYFYIMDNFEYCAPTHYVFGRQAELKVGKLTAQMLGNKVLLVSGGSSARRSGLLSIVEKSLEDNGVVFFSLTDIKPNPTDGPVRQGINLVRDNDLTGALAVGGGSVIDTAKAIALGALYDGDFWDFYSGKTPVEKALPVGTVLTIPAAGSEGSGNSVITLEDGMKKISLRGGHVLRPKFSLLNPEWTFTLPPYQTASGIVDMMAHIFERYYTATPEVETTDRIAEGLLKAIIEEAPKVMADGRNYDARANIMWAGTQAHNDSCGVGRTQEWVAHGMEHELSALYGVTHGAGLSVVFPAYMTFMAQHKPSRVAQMARRVFDVTEEDDKKAAIEGVDRLKAFNKSLGMPLTLSELGIENPDIPELTLRLHENKGKIIGNYYPLTATETAQIYRLCL